MKTRFAMPWLIAATIAIPSIAQTAPQLPAGAESAAEEITADFIEGAVRFLSDDLLEGRGPSTKGDRLTQLYLATEMQKLGLEPALDGSWYQPFDIVGVNTEQPDSWSFTGPNGPIEFDQYEDFIIGSGVQSPTATLENSELVFVGYGITAPEYQWDDFKGMDMTGKTLVIMNNDPDWDPALFEGTKRLYYGRWGYKYEEAARQGADGVIIIHTTPSAGYGFNVVQTSWSGEQFELPATGEPRLDVKAWMTEDAVKRLFTAAGKDYDQLIASAKSRDFRPVPLGLSTSVELPVAVSKKQTANVAGMLRGSDPDINDEFVIYTAHHDHLGMAEEGEDRIYNGAMDNATGTAQVLAMAKAFMALPERPRRSVMFLFVAAEEQGLLGSQYFAQNPSVPPGKIAANLNFDGGNIWGRTKDVALVGYGKNELDAIVRAFAARQGRTVKPEQFPDRGFYYRSDQFNFAKIGVPAMYADSGTEFIGRPEGWGEQQMLEYERTNYHQPSDEISDDWNYEGMIEDAKLGFFVGLAVATQDDMPMWNPGDEFEARRIEEMRKVGYEVGSAVRANG